MGLLRLAVFGSPEVFHDGKRLTFSLRKALALLLYLAVEGGMHSRSQLAALLWPDSEPHDARTALRNAIGLLRRLLMDPNNSSGQQFHLLSQNDLLGLNPEASLELDLDVIQDAWRQAQEFSSLPTEEQYSSLVAQLQHALSQVRGPFLDGFWLREGTAFDEWHETLRHQWQLRLQFLFEKLASWQESAGEQEQVMATFLRWLALDPLAEEAYRGLMRLYLMRGDTTSALQVYATCRTRLSKELQVKPAPETIALAENIRTHQTQRESFLARFSKTENTSQKELTAPLVGRAAPFTQLVKSFQQALLGQPHALLVVGEAGIGKTRLVNEFLSWAWARGADVLRGQSFGIGGQMPYQPLVEAIRTRLEEENAPEDLLDDIWLVELSRLLPELRVRYPDLPQPPMDEVTAEARLFEAVARLIDVLAQRSPLLLFLDDLHWIDSSSLNLVHYLTRYWMKHGSRVLLLGALRREGLEQNPRISTALFELGRGLPLTQIALQALNQAEVVHLVQAIVAEGKHGNALPTAKMELVPIDEQPEIALGNFLYKHTSGQPFYLLETLKLLRDRGWQVPSVVGDASGAELRRDLLPPSVRSLILVRLAPLSSTTRHLLIACAVLGNLASAERLWRLTGLNVQAGIEALEEAIHSEILREEKIGADRPGIYRFTHDLIRDVVYTELGEARRLVLHRLALEMLAAEGVSASELAYHALLAIEIEAAYRYSVQAGNEAMAVFAIDDAIRHYSLSSKLLREQSVLQHKLLPAEVEHLYVCLGRAYTFLNAWQQARETYGELLAYAQHKRLLTLVSMTLNRLAILAIQQSFDKSRAEILLKEALQAAETSQDQHALAETEWNIAQVTAVVWENPTKALPHGLQALSLARASSDLELEARSLSSLGLIYILSKDLEEAIACLKTCLLLYARLDNNASTSWGLSVAHFLNGAPPTQHLTNRAAESLCWVLLAMAQRQVGQIQNSIYSSRMALTLAQEIKNDWAQVTGMISLTYGLLDTGAYEEALLLAQRCVALARTLPPSIIFQHALIVLGEVYQAVQQWEEARTILEEEENIAETLALGPFRVPALSHLCLHYTMVGQWDEAYHYALKAVSLRNNFDRLLVILDFYQQYETEALLRAGDQRKAETEVERMGSHVGPYPRFRISYLRSLATLVAWKGESRQAIEYLSEAAQLAVDLNLPGERWQILALLGTLYETIGKHAQAQTKYNAATTIIQNLVMGMKSESLRSHFLASPQIQEVIQRSQDMLSTFP